MNLTKLISIKERIAIDDKWTPEERMYILRAINRSIQLDRVENMITAGGRDVPALRAIVEILNGSDSPMEAMAAFMIKYRAQQ